MIEFRSAKLNYDRLRRVTVGFFEPLPVEWRRFRLADEPYPDTYFEFPVSSEYLKK